MSTSFERAIGLSQRKEENRNAFQNSEANTDCRSRIMRPKTPMGSDPEERWYDALRMQPEKLDSEVGTKSRMILNENDIIIRRPFQLQKRPQTGSQNTIDPWSHSIHLVDKQAIENDHAEAMKLTKKPLYSAIVSHYLPVPKKPPSPRKNNCAKYFYSAVKKVAPVLAPVAKIVKLAEPPKPIVKDSSEWTLVASRRTPKQPRHILVKRK